MRTYVLSFILVFCAHSASLAQDALNMQLLGHLSYAQSLSDVRGAVHNGREYALVGVRNGLSIVDVSTPTNPVEVFFAPGASSTWRDPFYYNGHAYCVNEENDGLLIVDMSPLPAPGPAPVVTALPTSYYTGEQYPWNTAHNMSFDEQGHAYIYGSSYGVGGVIILDFSQNPTSPTELGVWNQFYVHDGFVRGDTLWAACVNNGFAAIVDISNPSSPQVITTWDTPSSFTHNIWPSDDNAYVFTTDEVSSGYIGAYDVSNPQNVLEVDRTNHSLTAGVIPHNVHWHNGYLVTSHYRDGVTIHDASDPANLVLTGYYDSTPLSGEGFDGSWGTWPYLPSGIILNSDIQGGLDVLQPTYVQAARIKGTVTNSVTQVPLSGVMIEVVSTDIQETTGIFGTYANGVEQAGSYTVTFAKGGFLPQTISGVQLVNGQTTVLDVQLVPDVPFTLDVLVTEDGTNNPIGNASLSFTNALFDINRTTDGNGQLSDPNFYEDTYDVLVGHWGHVTQCTTMTIQDMFGGLTFALDKQYNDDFSLDLGWQVTGSAPTGRWERAEPVGTFLQGQPSNPGSAVPEGCGNTAYVTGNDGSSASVDDVDNGTSILRSPVMDLTGIPDPVLRFHYWFFNAGGDSPPNDEFLVRISNGVDDMTLESLSTSGGNWVSWEIPLSNTIAMTDDMRVEFHISDLAPGHIVEGGIDQFSVGTVSGVADADIAPVVELFPNPTASGMFRILTSASFSSATARILDMSGREVSPAISLQSGTTWMRGTDVAGIYLVDVNIDGRRTVKRLVVQSD